MKPDFECIKSLLNRGSDFFQVVSLDGRLLYTNITWRKILGYTEAEVADLRMIDLLSVGDRDRYLETLHRLQNGSQEFDLSLTFIAKDGSLVGVEGCICYQVTPNADPEFWMLWRVIPIEGNSIAVATRQEFDLHPHLLSNSSLVSSQTVDISQAEASCLSQLEQEKELSELRFQFVCMMSHEFRNPLTAIFISAEVLKSYGSTWPPEKQISHLQRIQAMVKQMTELLEDILLIGQVTTNKLALQPTTFDLVSFCDTLVEDLQPTVTSQHQLGFISQAPHLETTLDEKLLRHILSNLLSNAIKYSPQGGKVSLTLVPQATTVCLQIQDQGVGIPTSDRVQLFDFFHRGSNVGAISGTGLGMAIVKRAVELLGGQIDCESTPGVGTTFTVTLPLNLQFTETERNWQWT